MSVQWFPGHMTKARRLIEAELKFIDVVVELADARIPEASRNPLLNEILGKRRPRLLVLNKDDLADPQKTRAWLAHYRLEKDQPAIAVDSTANRKKVVSALNEAILDLAEGKRERLMKKGARHVDVRAMIVGIPNVGKSTLINTLIGKASANTGNKPGVTKGKQWLRLSDDVELLDTPGMLWPKIEDEEVGYRLALTGAVSDEVFVFEEAAFRLVQYAQTHYPEHLAQRYEMDRSDVVEMAAYELMQAVGRKRGALVRGGQVDDLKTARLIVKDFRDGKLGRITLE